MIIQTKEQSVGNLYWARDAVVGQRRLPLVGGSSWPVAPSGPTTYRLYYDGNGATGDPPTDENEYGTGDRAVTIRQGGLSLEGYRWDSWNTAADGGGDRYDTESSVLFGTSDITLYAQWVIEE